MDALVATCNPNVAEPVLGQVQVPVATLVVDPTTIGYEAFVGRTVMVVFAVDEKKMRQVTSHTPGPMLMDAKLVVPEVDDTVAVKV